MKSLWKNKIYTLVKIKEQNSLFSSKFENKRFLPLTKEILIINRSLDVDIRYKYCKLKIYTGKFFYAVKIERDYFKLKSFKIGSLSLSRRVGNIHKEKKKNNRKKK